MKRYFILLFFICLFGNLLAQDSVNVDFQNSKLALGWNETSVSVGPNLIYYTNHFSFDLLYNLALFTDSGDNTIIVHSPAVFLRTAFSVYGIKTGSVYLPIYLGAGFVYDFKESSTFPIYVGTRLVQDNSSFLRSIGANIEIGYAYRNFFETGTNEFNPRKSNESLFYFAVGVCYYIY